MDKFFIVYVEISEGIPSCLGPSNPLAGVSWDRGKACSVCLSFGPQNPFVGYRVNTEESLIGFVMSPTFMLGIWHGGDWLKERFGSTQSMFGWYVEVPGLVGFCIC